MHRWLRFIPFLKLRWTSRRARQPGPLCLEELEARRQPAILGLSVGGLLNSVSGILGPVNILPSGSSGNSPNGLPGGSALVRSVEQPLSPVTQAITPVLAATNGPTQLPLAPLPGSPQTGGLLPTPVGTPLPLPFASSSPQGNLPPSFFAQQTSAELLGNGFAQPLGQGSSSSGGAGILLTPFQSGVPTASTFNVQVPGEPNSLVFDLAYGPFVNGMRWSQPPQQSIPFPDDSDQDAAPTEDQDTPADPPKGPGPVEGWERLLAEAVPTLTPAASLTTADTSAVAGNLIDPFWSAVSGELIASLPGTALPGQEQTGGRDLTGVLAAATLAFVPYWSMQRKSRQEEEEQLATRDWFPCDPNVE